MENIKTTLIFNVNKLPIKWHAENPNRLSDVLCDTPLGTEDYRDNGWVSTGIPYSGTGSASDHSFAHWIIRLVEIYLKDKKSATKTEVVELIRKLVAFHDDVDVFEFDKKHRKQ